MKRMRNSSQEESSSRRLPKVRCLSWEPLCSLMHLLLLMQQKKLRWDAVIVVKAIVIEHATMGVTGPV